MDWQTEAKVRDAKLVRLRISRGRLIERESRLGSEPNDDENNKVDRSSGVSSSSSSLLLDSSDKAPPLNRFGAVELARPRRLRLDNKLQSSISLLLLFGLVIKPRV